MKNIKTFESFSYEYNLEKYGKEFADAMKKSLDRIDKSSIKSIDEITKEKISDYVEYIGMSPDVNHSAEEVVEQLYELFNSLKSKKKFKLKRIIAVDSIHEINKNNLGLHFIYNDSHIDWSDIIESAGIDSDKKLFIVTVQADKNMIDIEYTIKTNMEYLTENEVTLKKNSKPSILNIKEY